MEHVFSEEFKEIVSFHYPSSAFPSISNQEPYYKKTRESHQLSLMPYKLCRDTTNILSWARKLTELLFAFSFTDIFWLLPCTRASTAVLPAVRPVPPQSPPSSAIWIRAYKAPLETTRTCWYQPSPWSEYVRWNFLQVNSAPGMQCWGKQTRFSSALLLLHFPVV